MVWEGDCDHEQDTHHCDDCKPNQHVLGRLDLLGTVNMLLRSVTKARVRYKQQLLLGTTFRTADLNNFRTLLLLETCKIQINFTRSFMRIRITSICSNLLDLW